MSEQAVGQLLVVIGFIAWAASWCGLATTSWLAVYCRQPWAATASGTSGLALFGAGIFALSTIPGGTL